MVGSFGMVLILGFTMVRTNSAESPMFASWITLGCTSGVELSYGCTPKS